MLVYHSTQCNASGFFTFFHVRHIAQCEWVYIVYCATLYNEIQETAVKVSVGLCEAFYMLGVYCLGVGAKNRSKRLSYGYVMVYTVICLSMGA